METNAQAVNGIIGKAEEISTTSSYCRTTAACLCFRFAGTKTRACSRGAMRP